jgi:hypothetical protein
VPQNLGAITHYEVFGSPVYIEITNSELNFVDQAG